MNFYKNSNDCRYGFGHCTTTFDTSLESWDFILFNEKILGTIGVPLWVPFGTQSVPIDVENFKNWFFYNTKLRHNSTQNGTQVVPQLLDTLYKKINFHDFSSSKNGHITTLGTIWGTIPNFWVPSIIFLENIPWLSEKKMSSISRDIYLPSFIFMIFYQIQDFHLWDKLHFLGTIEYSMVPKNFIIVKYEVSAF